MAKWASYPRIGLGHFPTPLEPAHNLRRALGGGPQIFIKRDDCTGLASGGNKTRKLEFLMGEAAAQNAAVVVTQGAVQSNHVRQTAAAAARCRMECVALLERRVADAGDDYEQIGNVLLDDIFGAQRMFYPAGEDMNAAGRALAGELAASGRAAYFIPGGGSNATGALGYVAAADELLTQLAEMDLRADWAVHGTGSAGTQAGLVAGFAGRANAPRVLGISVRAAADRQKQTVLALAQETAARFGGAPVKSGDVFVDDRFVGPGYGHADSATVAAIELLARTEGILLDPVYSGKAFAGLVARVREGAFRDGQNIVFWHTGGSAALCAYRRDFAPPPPLSAGVKQGAAI